MYWLNLHQMVHFDFFAYKCMSTLSNHLSFLMDEGLLSIISASCGQLVKNIITLDPHGIFGTYLF